MDPIKLRTTYAQELKARNIHGQSAIDGYEFINRLAANNAVTNSMRPNVFVKDIRNANTLDKLKDVWSEMGTRAKSAKPSMSAYYDAELIKVLNKLKDAKNPVSRDFINLLITNAGNKEEMARIQNIVAQCGNKGQKMNFAKKMKTFNANIAKGEAMYNEIEHKVSNDTRRKVKINNQEISREQWKDFFETSYNTTVEVGGNKPLTQNLLDKKVAETVADEGNKIIGMVEETGNVVDDAAKKGKGVGEAIAEKGKEAVEKGAEAARKIGPWGWVAIGAGALIALIAGVSAHNKNKQQQQLNAVA